MRCDEKVELSDGLTASLEISPEQSIPFGGLAIECEDRDCAEKIFNSHTFTCRIVTSLDSVLKLRYSNRRHGNT